MHESAFLCHLGLPVDLGEPAPRQSFRLKNALLRLSLMQPGVQAISQEHVSVLRFMEIPHVPTAGSMMSLRHIGFRADLDQVNGELIRE